MVGFVVKNQGNISVATEMRSVFHQDCAQLALDNFQTMQEAVDQSTFSQRLGLYLVASFAGLAVAMVVAGLYGVLSQLVGYRRHEIGVRMALGATRKSVAQMVLRQGSILIGIGLAVGLACVCLRATGAELPVSRTSAGCLDLCFRVAGPAGIGLVAALLPARKAASIQPTQALRAD